MYKIFWKDELMETIKQALLKKPQIKWRSDDRENPNFV